MKNSIVTKFVCSKCGRNLFVKYDSPKKSKQYTEGEPIGLEMIQQVITIEPCKCVTGQLKLIHKVLDILLINKVTQ